MAVFKCKMCGGSLDIKKGESIAICEYCGTKQTLPRLDDERRANLYDRANHFRRNNEYDKAMGIYETILNEDLADAEAYWSILLCKYGIEYVEDPTTHKYLPTINRAQFTSIFDDEDYKSAIKNADTNQKGIYESEANTINEIQKGILEISSKEEPFDVFICYKETGNNGRRTPDSVLATELYHELTKEGFKVFFSRITLEDKLGTAYEPYIFAALNSSKVMVVLGTKSEYFNAVWVKNEWSRYLALIKNGAKKMLIPAYRDMDPYDLPEEFSHLQAQDMGKIGFVNDLIRGIKKVINKEESLTEKSSNIISESNQLNLKELINKGNYYLSEKKWNKAKKAFDKVLLCDCENCEAQKGKMLATYKELSLNKLLKKHKNIEKYNGYDVLLKYADETNKKLIAQIVDGYKSYKLKQTLKRKTFLKFSTLGLSTLAIISAAAIFVIIPFVRYFVINNKLSDGQAEEAVSYYKNWKLIDYDRMIKSTFEKNAKNFEKDKDFYNAYKCYSAAKNDNKYQECMYTYGLENVNNENYSVAEKTFKEIKKYKDAEKYYYYSKGKIALNNNSVQAYDYFCECRNFNDTEKLIQNTEWLKKLECLQGSWELLTTPNNSNDKDYWKIEYNGTTEKISKEYYPTYEAAKSALENNLGHCPGLIIGTASPEAIKKFNTVKITKSVVGSEFIPALSVKILNENFDIISSDKFVYNSENEKYTVVRKK